MVAGLPATNSAGFFEIRMESIGGLGANLAGKMLAEAGVLKLGWNGMFSASYGSEKKGTPVRASIRFSDPNHPIRGVYEVDQPHVIAVFHEALLHTQSCTEGLQPGGVLLVNTTKSPAEIRQMVGLRSGTIACVDATGIAVRERTRVNVAMLGALCRVGSLPPEPVMDVIRETLGRKDASLVESNLRTFTAGYQEVQLQEFSDNAVLAASGGRGHMAGEFGQTADLPNEDPRASGQPSEAGTVRPGRAHPSPPPVLGYRTQPQGGVIHAAGNSVLRDLSASRQGILPLLNLQACIHCAACDQVCPDMCFVWSARQGPNGRVFQYLEGIDYQYCKGCLKCVEACPTDALKAGREEDGYAETHQTKHHFEFV